VVCESSVLRRADCLPPPPPIFYLLTSVLMFSSIHPRRPSCFIHDGCLFGLAIPICTFGRIESVRMSTLSFGMGLEIVNDSRVVSTWSNWRKGEPCPKDFALALVGNFVDDSLPCAWIKNYLRSPDEVAYGDGNWLIPTSDGRLMHMDGSLSDDLEYEPVSLTEAVLDMIALIRNPVLAA